jgi:hypothetical protein
MVPAATETTMANASTPQLMDMSLRRGRLSGTNCSRNFLAQVSWVMPDGQWSDHPGDPGADGGPSWVAAIVNAVGATKPCGPGGGLASFSNTVILLTWDDWGGFFDHVKPYLPASTDYPLSGYQSSSVSENGDWYVYGFRVPLLVVSPYTSTGYISGTRTEGEVAPYVHDFGSILGFVEAAFNLPPYDTNGNGDNFCGIEYAGDSGCHYPYADYFAPDGSALYAQTSNGCPPSTCPYPLSDFFNLSTQRTFTAITGAKYSPTCFQPANVNTTHCFPHYPSDPDDE